MITLLLVEDEPAVRKGLRMRLSAEPDMAVVGEAADGLAAVTLARELRPDAVVMDIEMPCLDGMAATQALRASAPNTAVIILTFHDDHRTQARARTAGAAAFISKRGLDDELVPAIRRAVGAP